VSDTEAVAEWIVGTGRGSIPAQARQRATEVSFDVLGTILAGSVQPLGKIITDYSRDLGGSSEATVLGSGQRTSAAQAAFVNGTLGHALDFDDTNAFGHDATILFPALLALAEKYGCTGADVIDGYVVGFEVGYALSRGFGERRFHRMPVFGRPGAAAAAAKILQLSKQQTIAALGIAGTMASGLNVNHGTMTKPLHGGLAARDGVMAAEMALRGWTASDQVLEHPLGFMTAFCGDGVNVHTHIKNLGDPFKIHDVLGIKKYPCGAGNHPIIDALRKLMQDHGFGYQDVAEVEVVQSFESVYMKIFPRPRTGLEGKFCIPYNVAATLVQGTVDIDTYTDERVADPVINEVMERVRVRVLTRWDVGLEKAAGRWPSGQSTGYTHRPVTVKLNDGRVLTENVMPNHVLGMPANPWGMENIAKKFEANAALALPAELAAEASQTWRSIDAISKIPDAVQRLTQAMRIEEVGEG
jgi:2-methylcitrate dehydratase PrpD